MVAAAKARAGAGGGGTDDGLRRHSHHHHHQRSRRMPGFLYHSKTTAQSNFYGSTEWHPPPPPHQPHQPHHPSEAVASSSSSAVLAGSPDSFLSFGNAKGLKWISKFFGHSPKPSNNNSWEEEEGFCSVVVEKHRRAEQEEEGGDDDDDNMETCPILGSSSCSAINNNGGGGIIFNGGGGGGGTGFDRSSLSSCGSSGRSVGSRFSVLSVSVPNHISFSLLLALFYSFMPYIVVNISLVLIILCSTTIAYSLIYMLCMCCLVAFLSEGILKKILKHPRPVHSSVPSFGMPSGHSAISITALVWWLLELREVDGGPWRLFAEVGQWARIGLACFFVILFLPVPWGRYWLRDHSFSQCLVGGCLGVVCGVIGYAIRVSFFS
eukprot:GHVS01057805.1.p1 GENE.GHVS01057805.1~~GHVS01057805.1.p1  ORF type:complete len:379 (-),score=94.34 GHVS01057805.1:700-1836(-)